MTEEWKKIVEYPNYSVSNLGRVRNDVRGRIRKTTISKVGYERIGLRPSKNPNTHQPDYKVLHRLVAKAFIDNPLNLPQVNHIDGNKLNNRPANLEWCTPSHNIQHSYDIGLNIHTHGSKHFASKITEEDVKKIRSLYKSGEFFQYEIAGMFGINQQNVSLICSGKAWAHVL
jgi:hypothetical protein